MRGLRWPVHWNIFTIGNASSERRRTISEDMQLSSLSWPPRLMARSIVWSPIAGRNRSHTEDSIQTYWLMGCRCCPRKSPLRRWHLFIGFLPKTTPLWRRCWIQKTEDWLRNWCRGRRSRPVATLQPYSKFWTFFLLRPTSEWLNTSAWNSESIGWFLGSPSQYANQQSANLE